ncbi:MAG TPA: adenylate/guanylate cyclase domain-containing protein [Membranihabitans sp.]|nr:adenylate/guanylate cyclase domain-containing protein [Membranihabitans sp.]
MEHQHPYDPNVKWKEERQKLLDEIQDLKVLYKTIAEHSSTIENELETKNQEITTLIQQLRKYLSPQLYNLILGEQGKTDLSYKRKFLTIFFSDIIGFTEISDRIDPEILSEVLNRYLNEMAQIAIKFGGTIDKFIGDALMIFFGDPEYVDDQRHAQDCGHMAIAMQKRIRELDIEWKNRGISHGLKVRMGMHSGYCTVGNFGSENRMDYTIIGGNVNIAHRLESLSVPNGIFISSITRNLLSEEFVTRFSQTFHVKGIHYPIDIYELLGYRDTDSQAPDSYLIQNGKGFQLRNIEFDPDADSPEKLQKIENTLHRLLSHIENNR